MATIRVVVECPHCHQRWHAATIDTDAWWGKGVTAQHIARRVYCPTCHTTPPMRVVPDLFADA